jgi:hypothetical protein
VFTGSAPELTKLLAVYDVKNDFEGNGTVTARLSGPVNSPKMTDIALKLAFENSDSVEMTGSVGNVVKIADFNLDLTGTLPPPASKEGEQKPFYDLGITSFSGHIAGSIDGVRVQDLHVITNSVKAQLQDIGPITAERLYKDPQGRLGLYDSARAQVALADAA